MAVDVPPEVREAVAFVKQTLHSRRSVRWIVLESLLASIMCDDANEGFVVRELGMARKGIVQQMQDDFLLDVDASLTAFKWMPAKMQDSRRASFAVEMSQRLNDAERITVTGDSRWKALTVRMRELNLI